MNHLVFTAVLTACLGIGGYQQGSAFFGPSPKELGKDYHYDPGQLNSSHTGPWNPLVSPHFTLSIVVYTFMYYVLTYFAGSFGRYNIHTKVFWWLMTVYPIVTTLTGFQFANLLPYLTQVVPRMSRYSNNALFAFTKELVDTNVFGVGDFTCGRRLCVCLWVERATVLNYLGACFGHDQSFKYGASTRYILINIVGAEVRLPGILGCGLVEYVSKGGRVLFSHSFFHRRGQKL
ncbi:hypothetical protein DSO57_1021225 [Entomophthora muscae]|uniref:Uncharacterized protein n=1 Tax=Entomophthora muscae TaxID=34485 RepID=A0ACC2TEU3_9FUNG|nr:hypothetical protein DSO57_1021225 [Entomophthora muscae]